MGKFSDLGKKAKASIELKNKKMMNTGDCMKSQSTRLKYHQN